MTASDTFVSTITGASNTIAVIPGSVSHFVIAGVPSIGTAAVAFVITVTSLDQYNNIATGYNGTIHFSSSDSRRSYLPTRH